MAETLASTLNRPVDPFSVVGQISRQPSVQSRGSEARRQLEPVMRAESEATGQAMRTEAEAARNLARQQAGVEEQAVRGMEQAGAQLEGAMGAYPQRRIEDFDPDAGVEMATMAALLGAFAGSLGGRSALKTMKGITEGYRAGKQDLYERQVAQFESEVQQYKDKVANAKSIYDNAIKLESQRRGAGMAKLREIEPLLQDSVISAKIRANDFVGAGEVIKNAIKLGDELGVKLAEATSKQQAKSVEQAQQAMAGLEPPPFREVIEVHSSGIPLAPLNPYVGVTAQKNMDAILQANLKDAQTTFDRIRKEDDKNSSKEAQMNNAEAALKRMTLKAFNKAKKEGKLPENAVLNLDTLTVSGGNLPQVTGGALGLPIIGEFLQQILTSKDPDASLFRTEAANYQRGSYVPGEGQISNFERELFKQAAIDLGRPPLTNLELIRATREAAKRQRDRKQFYEEYFAVNRTLQGAEQLWRTYSEANRFVTIDAAGNLRYNSGVPDYRSWFRSQQGQRIADIEPQQQFTQQPTQSSGGGLSPAEETRYQELLRKQRGGQ